MLKGKTVILGVTGGIAAYKSASLCSMLVKLGCDVHVLMTKNSENFINPIVFETLTNHKCIIDTFDRNFNYNVEHVSLAKRADLLMIAPASANVIGKIAGGIADDMLTTTVMACPCKKIIVPAMNTNMYLNPILQDNLKKLKGYGLEIVEPATGYLACGDTGIGKMPEPELLLQYILRDLAHEKDLAGKKVLITAGATLEAIDPVRFISNHSTGKMGYAIAEAAMRRGAKVTLISGRASAIAPEFIDIIPVTSAADMLAAVKEKAGEQDIIIKAAAVADYRPAKVHSEKMKKQDGETTSILELERTVDILAYLGENRRPGQYLCGFSMETENMVENSRKKLIKKNVDMIAANNLKEAGAGFAVDTNILTLITRAGVKELPLLSKQEAGNALLDAILIEMGENKSEG